MSLQLAPAQLQELRQALEDAFDLQGLEMLVTYSLGSKLDVLAKQGTLDYRIFSLIESARQRGHLDKLVRGARAERPDNEKLFIFCQRLGLTSTTAAEAPRARLEQLVGNNRTFVDVAAWRHRLTLLEQRVCQVRFHDEPIGTAFLVGPDAALTNHHVMAQVLAGTVPPGAVSLVFDYKRSEKGDLVHAGSPVALAADWNIAASPHSQMDVLADPKPEEPGDDTLDFALVRLASSIGRSPVGGGAGGEPRGWIEVSPTPYPFATRRGLAILQHPQGAPLKLALGMDALGTINAPGTRVRYDIPTLPGSSGSPVLDAESFRLIALHHAGDPSWIAMYNQGIPIAKIAAHPAVQAYLHALAGEE